MKPIRKVVIPVAGWGTRSLPATKNIPKEMLPIYNKPVIQHVLEEAQAAGITDVIFITNRDKSVIEDYFDHNLQLEGILERAGKTELLKTIRDVAEMVNVIAVRQKEQKGLGHAIACARRVVGDEPFAVMVGDDVIFSGDPGIRQLMGVAHDVKEVRPQHRLASGDAQIKALKVEVLFHFFQNPPVLVNAQFFSGLRHAVASAMKTMLITAECELQKQLTEVRLPIQAPDMVRQHVHVALFERLHGFPSAGAEDGSASAPSKNIGGP